MQQRTKRWVQRVQNNSTLEVVDVHSRCSKQALLGFHTFSQGNLIGKIISEQKKAMCKCKMLKKSSFGGVKSINVVDTNIFGMSGKLVNTRMHWKWYALMCKNKNGYCRLANISCIHMASLDYCFLLLSCSTCVATDSGALVMALPRHNTQPQTLRRNFTPWIFHWCFGENMFKTKHLQTRLVSRNTI